MTDWVVTDVRPRIMLCPLPKGFWWELRFIMRLDDVQLRLHRGRWWNAVTEVGDTHVVLDLSQKTPEEITTALIEGSYEVWRKYFQRVDSRQEQWVDTAREVADQLERKSAVRMKVKVDTSGSGRK